MKRIITYNISEKYQDKKIEYFLKDMQYPHAVIVQLKKTENGIMLNNKWAYVRDSLSSGDILTLTITEPLNSSDIMPVNLDINVVYEDEDLVVIDKPCNMPVHPSMKNYDNTLANAIMYRYRDTSDGFVYRCINRLDRDTTGLTIVAKNCLSGAILGRQVAQKTLSRKYLAICKGKVDSKGTINAPIARLDGSTIERCVDYEKGETAVTHYTLADYNPKLDLSLVQLQLETGRTHQIRVHMKHIGHPLIGDFLYNPDYSQISRQALHSAELSFTHPVTQQKMHLKAQLPLDMKRIFQIV